MIEFTVTVQTKKCFDLIQDEIENLDPYDDAHSEGALRLTFNCSDINDKLSFFTSPRHFEKVEKRLIFLNLTHSKAFLA